MRTSPITLVALLSSYIHLVNAIMSFLTAEQRTKMLALGVARSTGRPQDAYPVAKLFTPDANAVWLLNELDSDGDLAYGLCDVGLGSPELGTIRLSELASIRGPHGFKVAMDAGFIPKQPLSGYLVEAMRDGCISD